LPRLSAATSIFLDLYPVAGDRPDLNLLGKVAVEFRHLPWENLTKFIKKHHGADAPPAEAGGERDEDFLGRLPSLPGTDRLRLSAEVMSDHARLKSGGTCFSLTHALRRIVTDLGFHAYPAMADMRHGANIHCGLLVELDGQKYFLDPGYLVAEPVPLVPGKSIMIELPGHRLEYRPVPGSCDIQLFTVTDRGEETFRYRLRPGHIEDAEFLHHWLASFDTSGMNGLHLNRLTDEGRLSAHNLNLRVDNGRSKLNVKLRDSYVQRISDRFGIDSQLVSQAYGEWERRRCRNK
jgi:arylamine N-acetyltransferase